MDLSGLFYHLFYELFNRTKSLDSRLFFRPLRNYTNNYNQRLCWWYSLAHLGGHALGRAYRLVEKSANRADFTSCP